MKRFMLACACVAALVYSAAVVGVVNPNGDYTLTGKSYELRNGVKRNLHNFTGLLNVNATILTGSVVEDPVTFRMKLNKAAAPVADCTRTVVGGKMNADGDVYRVNAGSVTFKTASNGKRICAGSTRWRDINEDNPAVLVAQFRGVRGAGL